MAMLNNQRVTYNWGALVQELLQKPILVYLGYHGLHDHIGIIPRILTMIPGFGRTGFGRNSEVVIKFTLYTYIYIHIIFTHIYIIYIIYHNMISSLSVGDE